MALPFCISYCRDDMDIVIYFFAEVENYLRPKDFYVSVEINLFIFRVGR